MGRTICAVAMSLFLVTATFTPIASAAGAGGTTFEAYDDTAFVGHDGSVLTETAERLRSSADGPYHGKRSDGKPGKAGTGGKSGGGEKKGGKAGGKQSRKGKEKGKSGEAGNGKQSGKDKGAKNGKGPKKDNPGKAKGHGKSGKAKGHGKERGGGPPAACGKSTPASERAPSKAGGTPPGLAKKCGTEQTNQTNESLTPPGVDGTLSALELRVTAWRLLGDAPTSGDDDRSLSAAEAEELRGVLNGSFVHFVGFDRVADRAVFEDDKEVAATAGKRAPNVTAHLIVADETLARTAIGDAERVYAGLEDGEVDDDAVERELEQARRAVAQAEHVRSKSPNPVAAVTHYRRAWTHAQRALDLMDAATSPRVEIVDRADPAHDGPINYTVRGTVTDVRPWLVGNVTVSVNGEETTTPVFAGNATPGQVWGFAATVRLEEPVNRVEVSATDSGAVVAEGSEPFEPNEGTDVLLLDGDRLPDVYEANRTTTDPLDPDSDANATDADEGADNVTDGEADLDGDRLSNVDELELGTDPLAADTDGDGLTDAFEVLITDTDPLDADTDGDGTPDGEEDPDGDGLSNAEEERGGSDPSRVDGDFDGLSDPEELRIGTDPLLPDTDNDGLLDGRELEAPFHTDPLDPDTDDDGVLDGEETYTTTVANESLGASVAVTGPGDASEAVDVEPDGHVFLNNSGTRSASVSSMVDLQSARAFDRVEIALSYDESTAGNESDVAIYRYNRTLQTFVRLATTVDTVNDTARATTRRNGTYVAFENAAWQALFEDPLPVKYSYRVEEFSEENVTCEGSGECGVVDGALTVGGAGSVSTAGNTVRTFAACNPEVYLRCDDDGDGVENVFDDCLNEPGPPSNDGCPEGGGGGDGPQDSDGDGINDDEDDCDNAAGPSETDGCPDRDGDGTRDSDDECPDDSETATEPCFVGTATGATVTLPPDANEIEVEVDLEADVDESSGYVEVWLEYDGGREMLYSQHGHGGTFGLETIEEDVNHLAGETVTLKIEKGGEAKGSLEDFRTYIDTDGDGLWDNEEQEGFRMGNGETVTTHVNEEDSDHDGLDDSDEVEKRTVRFGWGDTYTYFHVKTNPVDADTDNDGIDDYDEVNGYSYRVYTDTVTVNGKTYSGPYRWRNDGRYNDVEDVDPDPWEHDTDGDEINDGAERWVYHTLPDEKVSYSITRIHQDRIVDPATGSDLTDRAEDLGLEMSISSELGESPTLNDRTDDFDFVMTDDHSLVFTALDRTRRTDTWFSNEQELWAGTDMRDPDSDDDGLTDGQEVKWLTTVQEFESPAGPGPSVGRFVVDRGQRIATNPNKNDTDDDGYWDGWIGVHDVGRTDNVVLYMEHLQTGNGIESGEIVDEQTELHDLPSSAPPDLGYDIDGDGNREHSKVHLGELHWGSDPTVQADDADEETRLDVEVDWIEGRNPENVTRYNFLTGQDVNVLEAAEQNFALYGFDVEFHVDQQLTIDELERTCKATIRPRVGLIEGCADDTPPSLRVNVTPDSFNRYELGLIEDVHHNDSSRMHMLWGTRIGNDRPKTTIDGELNYSSISPTGIALNNGAPGSEHVTVIEGNDFGTMIAADQFSGSDYRGLQSVTMHETGHALGAGWADDKPVPIVGFACGKCFEVYSGSSGFKVFQPDETPESIQGGVVTWSVMTAGAADDQGFGATPRLAFSIEEVSTIDFEQIPSREG